MKYIAEKTFQRSLGLILRKSVHLPRSTLCTRSLSSSTREWSTPLAKSLAEAIAITGPISIAAYMRQCLTSPDGGYYTSHEHDRDQFGQKGDFTTSPEVSQIFGELVGVWLVAEWMAQGKKSSGIGLIEVGPGRGTLMDDMLRTIQKFKPLATSIDSIYLVESSSSLRNAQKQLLCGDAPMKAIDIGYQSTIKNSHIPITWCEDIRFVPNDAAKTPFFFAHEFFDALPIHAFQSVAPSRHYPEPTTITPNSPIKDSKPSNIAQMPQWREMVVTPSLHSTVSTTSPSEPLPDFQLSLSKASTPNSLVLPEASTRYRALKSFPGSIIEISPEAQFYAAEFSRRIGGSFVPSRSQYQQTSSRTAPSPLLQPCKTEASGAALILDYGPPDRIPTSTLRGIRSHALVSPFSFSGQVDISADVDFTALADAALNASPNIEVHGPVEQGDWLKEMGGEERVHMLTMGNDEGVAQESKRKRIKGAWQRLVDKGGDGMGGIYKVMAIVPERGGSRRPVGFGGVVEE